MGNNHPSEQLMAIAAADHDAPHTAPGSAHKEATVLVVAPHAGDRQLLLGHIARHPQLRLQALIAGEPNELGIHVQAKADLLLLAMPEHYVPFSSTSLQLPFSKVILITRWPQHAVDAFEHDLTDVLLLPCSAARFDLAIERALGGLIPSPSAMSQRYIVLPAGRRSILVPTRSVLWAMASGNKVQVHLHDRSITAHSTLKQLSALLPPDDFVRVHRSYIVARRLLAQAPGGKLILGRKEIVLGEALPEENMELPRQIQGSE